MTHHTLDVFPKPEDRKPLFVNEPWLIDRSFDDYRTADQAAQSDNIRIYVPLDISHELIMRRLRYITNFYGEASEENEMDFSADVEHLIYQIEIYDQIWFARSSKFDDDENGMITGHSKEAVELARDFIYELESIPDACAECFPFETIDMLRKEYLTIEH